MQKTLKIFLTTAILAGILFALYYIYKTFIDNNMAKAPIQTGEIILVYSLDKEDENIISKIDVLFKTGELNFRSQRISSISFRLRYLGTNPTKFIVVDAEGNLVNKIRPNVVLEKTKEWMFPVNKIDRKSNEIIVDFAAINTNVNGFGSNDFITVATMFIKSGSLIVEDVGNFELVETKSAMYPKLSPSVDILNLNRNLVVDARKIGS